MTVIEERLATIDGLTLLKGKHSPDGQMCVMEAVAFVAGESWSDHPACACPVLGAFMRAWNDGLEDEPRQRLKVYVPRLVGSRSTRAVERQRGWLACDWLVRTFTPAWLRFAKLADEATALAALPPLIGVSSEEIADRFVPVIQAARATADAALDAALGAAYDAALGAALDAALDAAYGAARGAAYDAALGAARGAARGAALDAALGAAYGAARDAALGAALGAAYGAALGAALDAARGAALDAARDALTSTALALQESAFDLLDRMLAVTPETVAA